MYDIIRDVSSASDMEVDKMKKYVAIYARRSVSDNRSLSIETQIDECKKLLNKEEESKVYIDNGVSAKNLNRPEFKRMMSDVREGIISRIIVKKFDRFSRSMKDFFNVSDELMEYGVSVISLTEQIDTSTSAGKFMRNTILNVAEWERDTIVSRVTDAYVTRATTTGFWQGGRNPYYGYDGERQIINGVIGSVLIPNEFADVVKTMYDIYQSQDSSLKAVMDYFIENNINVNAIEKRNMDRSQISKLLKSPLYVKADADVYNYLVSLGVEIIDEIEAFDGVHGLFRHGRKGEPDYYKVGYHEGLIDSETWLAVQDKKKQNITIPKNTGAKNSWLVGLTKCGLCDSGLVITYGWNKARTKQWRYYRDCGASKSKGCKKERLDIRPDEVEEIVYKYMVERLNELVIAKDEKNKPDKEVEKIKANIIKIKDEISKLVDKVADADGEMFNILNAKVNKLSAQKLTLEDQFWAKTRKEKEFDTVPLEDPMSRWDGLSVKEKNALAKIMLEVVYISDEHGVQIKPAF